MSTHPSLPTGEHTTELHSPVSRHVIELTFDIYPVSHVTLAFSPYNVDVYVSTPLVSVGAALQSTMLSKRLYLVFP